MSVKQEAFNDQCNRQFARREAANIEQLKQKSTED